MQNALRMQHKKSYFFQAMNCILVSEINCIIRHFYVLSGCVPAPMAGFYSPNAHYKVLEASGNSC